jgi:hypothetical protein
VLRDDRDMQPGRYSRNRQLKRASCFPVG